MQLRAANSDASLRGVFSNPEYEAILADTGFRRPLSSLTVSDANEISATLKTYLLLKVKPELDQLKEGLDTCGVLESTSRHPELMAPLFVHTPVSLTKGQFPEPLSLWLTARLLSGLLNPVSACMASYSELEKTPLKDASELAF